MTNDEDDAQIIALDRARGDRVRPLLKFLSYSQMKELPEPKWLVEGVIQERTSNLIFGKSNAFKTFVGIDIGLSVETGRAWHGQAVSRGDVAFVASEGANGVGRLRIPAWYDYHGVPEDERGAFLYPEAIQLDDDGAVSDLIKTMEARGSFKLVILDIFGGMMSGSEIEDKTARAWVHGSQRILRETTAALLTIAHSGWQDDTRARMHTHFWGSFDTRMRGEGDKDALTATLSVDRHKDADSSGSWGFRLEPTGSSLVPVLDATVKLSKTRGLSTRQRIALEALDDAIVAHGQRKQGSDWPPCAVVSLDHWRAACDRHSLCDSDKPDTQKKAFQRARVALVDRKLIRILDGHVWRCFDD